MVINLGPRSALSLDTVPRRVKQTDTPSSIATAAAEHGTELAVLVREVQNRLRQVGSLDNASDLDGAFVFDEFADHEQELRRELGMG